MWFNSKNGADFENHILPTDLDGRPKNRFQLKKTKNFCGLEVQTGQKRFWLKTKEIKKSFTLRGLSH